MYVPVGIVDAQVASPQSLLGPVDMTALEERINNSTTRVETSAVVYAGPICPVSCGVGCKIAKDRDMAATVLTYVF